MRTFERILWFYLNFKSAGLLAVHCNGLLSESRKIRCTFPADLFISGKTLSNRIWIHWKDKESKNSNLQGNLTGPGHELQELGPVRLVKGAQSPPEPRELIVNQVVCVYNPEGCDFKVYCNIYDAIYCLFPFLSLTIFFVATLFSIFLIQSFKIPLSIFHNATVKITTKSYQTIWRLV